MGNPSEVKSRAPRLQGELDCLKVKELSAEKIMAEGADFYARWPKLKPV
jgi:hypothetical protein